MGKGKHLLGMAEIAFKHCAEGAEIMERIIQVARVRCLKSRPGARACGIGGSRAGVAQLHRLAPSEGRFATAQPLSYFHPSQ